METLKAEGRSNSRIRSAPAKHDSLRQAEKDTLLYQLDRVLAGSARSHGMGARWHEDELGAVKMEVRNAR